MWEIEKAIGMQTSYYFRLSTFDIPMMQEIESEGGEASYHYEELATYAKRNGLGNRETVLSALDIIREAFVQNLIRLRKQSGIPMRIVASHGDWINRRLGLPNWVILKDPVFRQEVKVELEVYDREFMRFVTSRYSDAPYPTFWRPGDPLNSILAGEKVVYILVHPRHWQRNVPVNLMDDIGRLWEGIAFSFKSLAHNA